MDALHPPPPPTTFRRAAPWLVTALVAVAPYAFGLDFPLLFDDRMAVLENPDVQGPLDLHAIFTHNAWGNPRDYPNIANYRPLSVLTLAATRAISGSPLPFHAGNVGLHVAACLLLLALARRLGASAAAATLAACWFAAHPVHVEAVMLAVNREEILVTLFCGALLWLAAPRTSLVPDVGSEPWPRRLTLAVALLGGLALLSKENGLVLPAMLGGMLLLWPPERPVSWAAPAAGVAVLALVAVAYLALRARLFGQVAWGVVPFEDNPLVRAGLAGRLTGALAVLAQAARLLVVPGGLTLDYGFDVLALPADGMPAAAWAGAAVAMAGIAGVLALRERVPAAALGLLVAGVAWAPFSHLLTPASILLAERNLYLPSFGIALALSAVPGVVAARLGDSANAPRLRQAVLLLLGAWVVALGLASLDRVGDYRSARTLFESSLQNRPGSVRLHNNLGVALVEAARPAEAEEQYRRALAIDAGDAEAHNNLANLLQGRGELRAAASEYVAALALRPGMPLALRNLCALLVRAEDYESADRWCNEAARRGEDVSELRRKVDAEGSCHGAP